MRLALPLLTLAAICVTAGSAAAAGVAARDAWTRETVDGMSDAAIYLTLVNSGSTPDALALSPDGRILSFVRGQSTFYGKGEIYAKLLPSGEPVQLTHDSVMKMSPQFSADGANIAYTTLEWSAAQGEWGTWVIPALGGEPRLARPMSRSALRRR